MKILITGAQGQLGTDLCNIMQDDDLVPLTHDELDITDLSSVMLRITTHLPDVVINTAAYVRVDDCETNPDRAFQVNALGAGNVAVACQEIKAKVVHISSDYVFGGERSERTLPYTEFDCPSPLNIYGQSKLLGEHMVRHACQRHFIVRSSGLFGTAGSSGKGGNFVESILQQAKKGEKLTIISDQLFSPTFTRDLAEKLSWLVRTRHYGIFHITNKGICSWYDFGYEIMRLTGLSTSIVPLASSQYPQKAMRPRYSALDNYRLRLMGMDDMKPWPEALRDYLKAKRYI